MVGEAHILDGTSWEYVGWAHDVQRVEFTEWLPIGEDGEPETRSVRFQLEAPPRPFPPLPPGAEMIPLFGCTWGRTEEREIDRK